MIVQTPYGNFPVYRKKTIAISVVKANWDIRSRCKYVREGEYFVVEHRKWPIVLQFIAGAYGQHVATFDLTGKEIPTSHGLLMPDGPIEGHPFKPWKEGQLERELARRAATIRDGGYPKEAAYMMEAVRQLQGIRQAVEDGGLDLSPCMLCSRPVICVPDGMPMCKACAEKEQQTNDSANAV